tara:strand:- start:433 stop:567 length:135 start_codon:yes stop_codon:yes gene_type:complete
MKVWGINMDKDEYDLKVGIIDCLIDINVNLRKIAKTLETMERRS